MNRESSDMLSLPSQEEIETDWCNHPSDRFGISSLTLERYRCFNKLHIDFDPYLTLISAPNGEVKPRSLMRLLFH